MSVLRRWANAGLTLVAPLRRHVARVTTFAVAAAVAVGFVGWYEPPGSFSRAPFAGLAAVPNAEPAADAYGRSGAVQMRFALPGGRVEYPLEVYGDPTQLGYAWVNVGDSTRVDSATALRGDSLTAPTAPGFYHLSLVRGGERRTVEGLTVAVLVPFEEKRGPTLDGYEIGTFLFERGRGRPAERPEGFVRVTADMVDLQITKHIRVGDFLTRDEQTTWPRYAAVNPRVLDKLELVVSEIMRWKPNAGRPQLALNVHSGFRTPGYNRTVSRAAKDSRHQYGDAIDVAIDANGDGRLNASDVLMVATAVEAVERQHPDLVGGMGLYTSRHYHEPYVHIDARGHRARWKL